MKISFMVAGVQKGGTTAMYQNLRSHAAIGMPKRKEPHFFDRDRYDWSAPDYGELHRLYEPSHAVYGESTPVMIYWTSTYKRFHAYNPEMRFILLFRDPIERAYSHWCMEYARRRETSEFGVAIRSGRERVGERHRVYSYVERGFYAAQLDALRSIFPDARVLSLTSEELLSDRTATMTKVAGFIDVDCDGFDAKEIVVRTKKPVSYPSIITDADRSYLKEVYAHDLERFARITNLDIGRWSSVSEQNFG